MISALRHSIARRYRPRPIIVMGGGRSGTTILLVALSQHAQIVGRKSESPILGNIGTMVAGYSNDRYAGYYERSTQLDPTAFYLRLQWLALECCFGPSLGLRLATSSIVRRRAMPTHWCARAYPDGTAARGLLDLFPHARLVFISRGGGAVVRSRMLYEAFRHMPFEEHCRIWASTAAHYEYMDGFAAGTTVRQEDLVRDPEGAMDRLVAKLGLPPDPTCGQFVRTTSLHPENRPTSTAVDVQDLFAQRPSPYADWTSEQLDQFRAICGEQMRRLGYDLP